jgi:hypothetical protein
MKRLLGGTVMEGTRAMALTLVVDTYPIIFVSNGSDTGSGIQEDLERMEASIVPSIPVLDL